VVLAPEDITAAMAALNGAQPLHAETHAVHGAGFFIPGEGLIAVREDVGRHNALDKLVGAVIRAGREGGQGIVVVTSRISVEMVQKTAILGSSTLVALTRGEDFEIFAGAERIGTGSVADVA
jgi:FdhD protein